MSKFIPFMMSLCLLLSVNSYASTTDLSLSPTQQTKLKKQLEGYQKDLQKSPEQAKDIFSKINALDVQKDPLLLKMKQNLYRWYGFYVRSVRVNQRQEKPRICVNFTGEVQAQPLQEWQKLITVTPAVETPWQYQGNVLCFDGKWKTEYQISLDPKLQSTYQLPLYLAPEKRIFNINSGNRYPMVRFTSQATILDIQSSVLIPIQLANVAQAQVSLWRVPANNLSNQEITQLIENAQSSRWNFDSLVNHHAQFVYSGKFDLNAPPLNATVTRNINVKQLAPQAKAGIYLLKVTDADSKKYDKDVAIKAFMLSTDGLSAYMTPEGLWAELRSLKDGKPQANKKITLYAKDNEILGTVTTDKQGLVTFPQAMIRGTQGGAPSHLIYETPTTLAYLSIAGAGIDLSNKGLSGDNAGTILDTWLWADRGVYRPNDNSHLMWLVKDKQGKTFSQAPIWINVLRPDGLSVLKKAIPADKSGSYRYDLHFADNAMLGDWRIRLSLAKDGSGFIKQQVLPVLAVSPQQIAVNLKPDAQLLQEGQNAAFNLQTNWLYGAPASGLTGSVNWHYQNREKWSKYADYQIGVFDEKFMPEQNKLHFPKTDKQGVTHFQIPLNALPFSTRPLSLQVETHVATPTGQDIQNNLLQAIRREDPYVAIKVEDKIASIALINEDQQLKTGELQWKLYRRHFNYYWYRQANRWNYQSNESRSLVKQGTLQTHAQDVTLLSLPLDDGLWVLEVKGQSPKTITSVPIEYGAYAANDLENSPDLVQITTDKKHYNVGDTVRLHLSAPFDGEASLKLAQDGILSHIPLQFKNGKASYQLKWKKAWDKGLWLLASVWNKKQNQVTHKRAVGLTWIGGNRAQYDLPFSIQVKGNYQPNQRITIPLSLSKQALNVAHKGKVWAQVAIIDDALYQLAAPSFSSPLDTFMGKKQLPIKMYDTWGRIISPVAGREAVLRQGAGAQLMRTKMAVGRDSLLPDPEVTIDTNLYTYWSAPVSFDEQGLAQVSFDIPDTNTQFRMMATIWNDDRISTQEQTFRVKSDIVTQLYLPPFLTKGDKSNIKIYLDNTTTAPQKLQIKIASNEFLSVPDEIKKVQLNPGASQWLSFPYQAMQAGQAQVKISITGDKTQNLQGRVDIRELNALGFKQSVQLLQPNQSVQITPSIGAQNARIMAFAQGPIDVQSLLQKLTHDDDGSVAQIVSQAWGQLWYPQFIATPKEKLTEITKSQIRLVNVQNYDGSFSLWGKDQGNLWLTSYVADYLLTLKDEHLLDNPAMLNAALTYLRNAVFNHNVTHLQGDLSYAHRVLAQSGASTQGALLSYINGQDAVQIKTNPASLDAALALLYQGEIQSSADFIALVAQASVTGSPQYYGSYLRDVAQSLSLIQKIIAETQRLGIKSARLQQNERRIQDHLWTALNSAMGKTQLSHQEIHWLMSIAHSRTQTNNSDQGQLLVYGLSRHIPAQGALVYKAASVTKATPIEIKNTGTEDIYLVQSFWDRKQNAASNSLKLEVDYLNAHTGDKIQLEQGIAQNALIAVAVKVDLNAEQQKTAHDFVLNYPLPLGFTRVTMTAKVRSQYLKRLNLKDSGSRFIQDNDARHWANFFTYAGQKAGYHVFFVRASRQGQWQAPSYQIQEIFNPSLNATYKGIKLTVIDK